MKTVVCDPAVDEFDGFRWDEADEPTPTGFDLLVRVAAVSVNPIDTKMRVAARSAGKPRVLGWDAAGEVIAAGEQVTQFQPGDKVWYAGNVKRSGSNAQTQLVDSRITGQMPSSLNVEQAAALPLTTLTAFEGLFERLYLGATVFGLDAKSQACHRQLLVVGGAGGVGSIAIQLARLVPDLTVVATASRDESRQWCTEMGAHHVINHHGDLVAESQAIDVPAYDGILLTRDPDGYFQTAATLTAALGQVCSIVDASDPLPVMQLRARGAGFTWEGMFARSTMQSADMARQGAILSQAARWIDEGKLRTTLTTDFGEMSPENLSKAHRAVEAGTMIGKGVLRWA